MLADARPGHVLLAARLCAGGHRRDAEGEVVVHDGVADRVDCGETPIGLLSESELRQEAVARAGVSPLLGGEEVAVAVGDPHVADARNRLDDVSMMAEHEVDES